jgi:hypothetical protein
MIKVWSLHRSDSQKRKLLFSQAGILLKAKEVMFAQAVLYQTTLRIGKATPSDGELTAVNGRGFTPTSFL